MLDDLYEIAPDGAGSDGAGDADTPPDILLRVHVQPGAGRNSVMGRHGDALKVKVGAPPEGGRANAAVLALVASTLGVPESSLSLESGEKSRAKRVRIRGVAADEVGRLLELAVDAGNDRGHRGVGRP